MEQLERIRRMEACLRTAEAAVRSLSDALDGWADAAEDIRTLDSYYGSEEWRRDREADEAGLLPKDLRRGVLGEDEAWNVLDDARTLSVRLREAAARADPFSGFEKGD